MSDGTPPLTAAGGASSFSRKRHRLFKVHGFATLSDDMEVERAEGARGLLLAGCYPTRRLRGLRGRPRMGDAARPSAEPGFHRGEKSEPAACKSQLAVLGEVPLVDHSQHDSIPDRDLLYNSLEPSRSGLEGLGVDQQLRMSSENRLAGSTGRKI